MIGLLAIRTSFGFGPVLKLHITYSLLSGNRWKLIGRNLPPSDRVDALIDRSYKGKKNVIPKFFNCGLIALTKELREIKTDTWMTKKCQHFIILVEDSVKFSLIEKYKNFVFFSISSLDSFSSAVSAIFLHVVLLENSLAIFSSDFPHMIRIFHVVSTWSSF